MRVEYNTKYFGLPKACNFIKKETLVQVNFAKFLRTPFLQHTWRQLLKPALFEVDICFISTSN